jgi:hypothetical protein
MEFLTQTTAGEMSFRSMSVGSCGGILITREATSRIPYFQDREVNLSLPFTHKETTIDSHLQRIALSRNKLINSIFTIIGGTGFIITLLLALLQSINLEFFMICFISSASWLIVGLIDYRELKIK